ncbi:NCS1 family nucleobase:cation symporter-1 [Acinetobacter ursingii]|jgi:NCS1 family nucleobase:cation symporter-1|uniref:NCS1 nucleoside transporter family protein n=1 Tax=Acinetobacter haemolyticus ATCC 19194 TaxID=707232 RepID=D4XKC8_ACIHA|nr:MULTISPECIES: NCS1 family nucleobase:cation symporter-1 [Acinetobacter]EFF84349.1 NCS1 nucleoside transporter family protein [Acinetobacter haemolyticus ATCC 19194]MDH2021014.1 NCS1 family nucleobase:cation symporter-1 [Acinetobacter ursingii]MDH2073382.1 NCS1 family nucleobase:cation symporter-1 [Acinetobacter ursingii]
MENNTEALIKPSYDPALTNQDLAPLKTQTWGSYNIFAFWMSDVHSVGGYVTAGSLFALGLNSWQVLVSLLIGIVIVQFFANLIAKPSQKTSTPFPVICRATFGVQGANIPAVIRGLIAVAWYGIQTYLASSAFILVILKFFPDMAIYADVKQYGFLGLSYLGWIGFMLLWVLQAVVFWSGMDSIRKFIDWAGPAVYVLMFAMAAWLVYEAGWENIDLNLGGVKYEGLDVLPVMIGAIALVVSYFSGPVLNFGDFSRYGKTFEAVKFGNFLGLPVNFLGFSLLTVVCIAATLPIYGKLITDPVEMVGKLDNTFVVILGSLTLMIATVGINIVANFVSPAFDFSNVSPSKISWRMGGMIAAVGSIFITPWNLFNNPQVIHYTIDILGAFIGPLFGILIADYYFIKKQNVVVDDLYTLDTQGSYWYKNGYNCNAIYALIPSAIIPILCVLIPQWHVLANFSWFIGMFLGLITYSVISIKSPVKYSKSIN